MRLFILLCCCLLASIVPCSDAFTRPITPRNGLLAAGGVKKELEIYHQKVDSQRLIQQHAKLNDDDEDVRVDLIPDVDAFSLTAIGFGLIAFNFLVLANVSVFVIQCLFYLLFYVVYFHLLQTKCTFIFLM